MASFIEVKNLSALSNLRFPEYVGITKRLLTLINLTTKVSTDHWKDACDNLRDYYKNSSAVIEKDINEIKSPLSFWKEHSGEMDGPDIIYGGPPCQSFSQAGKQRGISDRREQLTSELIRIVDVLKPAVFVMENVANLKGIAKGELYNDIVKEMDSVGYNVVARVFLAADYGALQLRSRIIFIGTRKDVGMIDFPDATHGQEGNLLELPYSTVEDAFKGLPKLM